SVVESEHSLNPSEVSMSYGKLFVPAFVAAAGISAIIGSLAIADAAKESAPAGQAEGKLPPGWTMDDMKACIAAGTPGKMHELLAKDAGEWTGKSTMVMGPDGPPMTSECTSKVTVIMGG